MYYANRQVDDLTRRQRWLKYVIYILIIATVLAGIFGDVFFLLAGLIGVMGSWEVWRAIASASYRWFFWGVLVSYGLIAAGFLFFAFHFERNFLLFIYFQVVTFDGFSQITGQLVGKRRLIPTISPGKTVEGCIGGVLFCLLSAVLAKSWIHGSLLQALSFGLLTSLFSFLGDTLASYCKRRYYLKDYSNLLPGHGGFLDRFDSLMMVGLGYTCLMLLNAV